MEAYTPAAVERAMKVQEVILRAMAGKMKWIEAAEVLGIQPRTLRRWKRKMERVGGNGLLDGRRRVPSAKKVTGQEVTEMLRLYRERYAGFNVRHFHEQLREHHGVTRSYTLVKQLLQEAGLVRRHRARGKHRQRRERRACFGEMLHLDGSRHHWLALAAEQWQSLITVVDDATGRLLYAQLWPSESRTAVLSALRAVFVEYGLPQQLYTDRATWAAYTPRAGARPAEGAHTQVQRALAELGLEHLRAFSPQARGRSERANRTLQGRLVNELRLYGVATLEAANRFLREQFCADYNVRFGRPAADPACGFVPVGNVDLDHYLCVRVQRVVGRDNTVVMGRTVLQIPPQSGRRSCQGLRVSVRQHLDRRYTVSCGPRRLARYEADGAPIPPDSQVGPAGVRAPVRLLERHSPSHRPAKRPTAAAASKGPSRKRSDHLSKSSGQITC